MPQVRRRMHWNQEELEPEERERVMDKELAEIRKEIVEARNLVIKNDNLLKNLGSDLKALGKKQEAFERKQWIASGAAYLGFVVLAAAAALFGARGYVAQARSDAEGQAARAEKLSTEAEGIRVELAAQRKAEDVAFQAYARLGQGSEDDRRKAVEALQTLDRTKLSKLASTALDDRSRGVVHEIANQAYDEGRTAFRRQDYRTTVAQLTKAVALWPDHPDADDVSFPLGAAAIQTRDWATAATALQRYIDRSRARASKDYAFLLLGQAYEALGQKDKAAAIWTRGSADYAASEFAPMMRRRLSAMRRGDAAAAGAPATAAPAPSAAPQPN